ncbi:hypothetical protein EJD97_005908 [Solanum chilense]|uniref:Ubiquitin-like protease family profile domain-containing protein n=1 Tax=Solanum chilense TaxID=4083 RepID=A0A6N2BYZ4_SOLCI|nr:hypothetical protein EJD97_005908 [Solanum chilense]
MLFRTHGNQHKFRNIIFTEEELNVMDDTILNQSNNHHNLEEQGTSEKHDVDFEQIFIELKAEIAEMELKDLKVTDNAIHNVSMDEYVHMSNTDVNWEHLERTGCLHVYDSIIGGSVHTRKVQEAVNKLATMIPLFLSSIRFYSKRLDWYANNLPEYQHKSQSEPLSIKHVTDVPQQQDSSNDCGLYTSLFAEYMSNGVFDVSDIDIDSTYHRQRYATLLWHYAKSKNEEGAISESEVMGTVASKYGGPRMTKEQVMDTTNYPTRRPRIRK